MSWLGIGGMVLVGMAMVAAGNATAAELKPGDKAPDFNLPGSDGKTYKLSDFRGKQAVVLAWFPKAFTPGCTNECKAFRADGDSLRAVRRGLFHGQRRSAGEEQGFRQVAGTRLSDPQRPRRRRWRGPTA